CPRRRARRVRVGCGCRTRLRRGPHRHARRPDAHDRRGGNRQAAGFSHVTESQTGYRVGIDVGGTFTDLICVTPEGRVVLDKTPTTPDDQSLGVMNGLQELADRFDRPLQELCAEIDILVHGTTTADNTMIEMNGAPTGLLVTEGHRDEIEMR